MTKIIYEIDSEYNVFYVIVNGKKTGFHLPNRLAKTFYNYLDRGILVDFEITGRRKRIKNRIFYQVAFFNRIVSLNPYRIHYDLFTLRSEMETVLRRHKYFLFLDFEMTMPGYTYEKFSPEIIQVGYVLAEAQQGFVEKKGYYILPLPETTLSKRTKRFLKLDELKFYEEAFHFEFFYDDLKRLIKTYKPKLVVWGKNDIQALHESYELYQKKPLTRDWDFIDLLKLHKDYYNLKDDLGLFKAFQTYYQKEETQVHDAQDDAIITKHVFDAFLKQME